MEVLFEARRTEHPQKGFLAQILDSLRAARPGAEFDEQQFAKISGEMLLCSDIAILEALYIFSAEGRAS